MTVLWFVREKLLKLHQKESEYLNAENQALKQRYDEIYSEAKQDYEYTRDYNKIQVVCFSMSSFVSKSVYRK